MYEFRPMRRLITILKEMLPSKIQICCAIRALVYILTHKGSVARGFDHDQQYSKIWNIPKTPTIYNNRQILQMHIKRHSNQITFINPVNGIRIIFFFTGVRFRHSLHNGVGSAMELVGTSFLPSIPTFSQLSKGFWAYVPGLGRHHFNAPYSTAKQCLSTSKRF